MALAAALARQMEMRSVTVSALGEKLGTRCAAVNRVLDEENG